MKKLLFSLLAISLCMVAHADTWQVEVTTNAAVTIAPTAQARSYTFTVWDTNATYAAGTYVKNADIPYWTPNGGTSGATSIWQTNGWNIGHTVPVTNAVYTAAPVHLAGMVTEDDGIIWKRVSDSGREYIILHADASIDVLYDLGTTATTNSGGLLGALYPKQALPVSSSISAIALDTAGTAIVHVVEF